MIQFHTEALLVRHTDGRTEPLMISELADCLAQDPVIKTIGLHPWVLEKITESIISHFREELKLTRVSLGEFLGLAQALMLSFCGEQSRVAPCSLQLDLFETARRCGTGFELEFFSELRRFLALRKSSPGGRQAAVPDRGRTPRALHLTGLRRCAKFLAGRRRWCKRCVRMQEEILGFIRQEARRDGIDNLLLTVVS